MQLCIVKIVLILTQHFLEKKVGSYEITSRSHFQYIHAYLLYHIKFIKIVHIHEFH